MCESGIFLGGYLQIGQDTEIDLGITGKGRGLNAKRPAHLQPLSGDAQERMAALVFLSPTTWGSRVR